MNGVWSPLSHPIFFCWNDGSSIDEELFGELNDNSKLICEVPRNQIQDFSMQMSLMRVVMHHLTLVLALQTIYLVCKQAPSCSNI